MAPRDNVWVAQRGYSFLSEKGIKGNVVSTRGGSGDRPTPAFSFGDIDGGFFADDYIDTVNVDGGLFTDTYINTANIGGGLF